MNSDFALLHRLLRQRLDVIADHAWRDRDPSAHLDALRNVSEAIQAEQARLRPQLPPRLQHYLQQSSLQKALEYLEMEA